MHLVWFRNDLRLTDNPALFFACDAARRDQVEVRAIFCSTPDQWQEHHDAGVKLGLQNDALKHLQQGLAQLGVHLSVLHGKDYTSCSTLIEEYCRSHGVTSVWCNGEVPFNEQQRDFAVKERLQSQNIDCQIFQSDFLVPPELLKTGQGGVYKVFTPWYKSWRQKLDAQLIPLPIPEAMGAPISLLESDTQWTLPGATDYRKDLWSAEEDAVLNRAQAFCQERMHRYLDLRDIPSVNGTSTLSPYFASGLISARSCLQFIKDSYSDHASSDNWREDPWLREIAWREFYRYLMLGFPSLSKNRPFKAETQYLQWECNPELVKAWQEGMTGFPIIDAAMRQLARTGWMHNRLRMLTASFLTKLMLEHWQVGERYFMEQLIDGDFPSNNGGWQWSASTGCDASPWFRVFNPTTQSEKFDPEGRFIRKMLPELADLDNKAIHNPPLAVREHLKYPAPIIDYRQARQRVLDRFKALNEAVAAQ